MRTLVFMTVLLAPALLIEGAAAANQGGLKFRSNPSAAQEVQDPAVVSDGAGAVQVRFARDLSAVAAKVEIADLTSGVAAGHLHCAPAGQNGPVILDLMPTAGASEGTIVDDRFTNDDLSGADCEATCGFPVNNIASLRFAADEGCIYVNIHSETFPGGELRGQLLEKKGGK
jgi:hypothetical protein